MALCSNIELNTSSQRYGAVKMLFDFLKHEYEEKYNQPLWFKYIVCDYSWPTMHAVPMVNYLIN